MKTSHFKRGSTPSQGIKFIRIETIMAFVWVGLSILVSEDKQKYERPRRTEVHKL